MSGAILVVAAVAEAIRDLGEVPSGHLYARLSDRLALDQYQRVIETLKRAGLITETHNLLRWVQ